ncbi:MAG: Tetraacyldisaccharide 4'-kinase [Gammaproteobacteria bacterium]|nr:Tetraacyldisaccharide 4'-kinase [Gammaproteobacteria bacterium]
MAGEPVHRLAASSGNNDKMIQRLRLAAPELWRTRSPATRLLLPLSWMYMAIVRLRRSCYASGLCRVVGFRRPVVVVGGIASGGSGKTPLAMHVTRLLVQQDLRPGIVSRGYGGSPSRAPLVVNRDTPAAECGDEAAMMARNLTVPIVVDANRPRGVNALISRLGCDVVVSDDGLQHYAMDRQVEIAVVGGGDRFGNGYCLPAGPLREPRSRLKAVDMVVSNGSPARPGEYSMNFRIDAFCRLNRDETRPGAEFRGRRVHAIAGIGNPIGFFSMVSDLGLDIDAHPFPDHYRYKSEDFSAMQDAPIVMTEKDAVKCLDIPLDNAWYAPIITELNEGFDKKLIELLKP